MDLFDQWGEDELLIINVKHLGLKIRPWEFSRGRKLIRNYEDENDELRASEEYEYLFSDEDRITTPIKKVIKWYKIDGTVGLEKEVELEYSIKDLQTIHRSIRQGRIDYMEGAGRELATLALTMPEPFATSFTEASNAVSEILYFYDNEISKYIKWGTLDFENAVRNETDETMLSYFNLVVRPPDDLFPSGLNIKQTILHQLTGEYNP